jgi:hypothetical protein
MVWVVTIGLIVLIVLVLDIKMTTKNATAELKRQAADELRRKQQQEDEIRLRNKKVYEEQQRNAYQHLLQCVTSANSVFNNLPDEIRIAEHTLNKAEEEFADGAFAPFWDAVESAVTNLARFDQYIQQILSQTNQYNQKRKELDSTPPLFKFNTNDLPNATAAAERLRSIVRRAQKDFHFATIYEQRKTNQILVSGFQNLGQALSEMTYRIESSLDALSASFSDSMSNLAASNRESAQEIVEGVESVRNQLKSDSEKRRDHERKEREMLDNIQRGRKPFP